MPKDSDLKRNYLKTSVLPPPVDGGKEIDFTYFRHLSKLLHRSESVPLLADASQRVAQLEEELAATKARCQELEARYEKTVDLVRRFAVRESKFHSKEAERSLREPAKQKSRTNQGTVP